MSNGNDLTPDEREEVYELYMRLHDLYPERGHDVDARYLSTSEGRAELADLRKEVAREEYLAEREEEDEDG